MEPQKAEEAFDFVIQKYSEPGRFYHNTEHILEVLRLVIQEQQIAKSIEAVEFAAFFHDIVYDTRAGDNEEKSAGICREIEFLGPLNPRE